MLRNNVIANFIGRVWPSLLSIVLVPVYLHYLGIEAYGLIGLFVALQALISFLDLGLSATVNREVAFGLKLPNAAKKTRDLLRTLEMVYGAVSILIAAGFFFAADWLARVWINSAELSLETVRNAAIVFGVMLALRWPVSLYTGVLQGSERQVLQNVLYAAIATLRGIGSAIVVAFLSPTIQAYLFWQMVAALLELIVMAWAAWKTLPLELPHTPRVDFSLLKGVWKYSASISANSLIAALLKQLDRVFIARFLTLQAVGYYTTANVIYSAVELITVPIASAAFPRFSALIAEGNHAQLAAAYHKTAQYISFVAAPISAVFFFFSREILFIWTRSADVALNAAPTLSVLALAALFNSMMRTPFRMQLAAGITSIVLWNNAINLVFIGPMMYFLIAKYHLVGAGIAWLIFNVLYYLIVPHIMHRQILQREKLSWFFRDTLSFMLLGFLPFGTIYWIGYADFTVLFVELALGGLFYLAIVMRLYPAIRMAIFDLVLNNPLMRKIRQAENVVV